MSQPLQGLNYLLLLPGIPLLFSLFFVLVPLQLCTLVVTVEPTFFTVLITVALFSAPSHTWPHTHLPLIGSPMFPI
jgi:hypothetical protein